MANTNPEIINKLRSEAITKVNQGKKRTHGFTKDYSDINPDFVGKFIVHYPSQMEKLQMGVIKSTLLNGNPNVDVETYNIAYMVSALEVVVDTKPDWFDVFDPEIDYDILEDVFNEYQNWVDSFRKPDKSSNTTGDGEGHRS
jgi:hypothetical protein